MIIYLYENDNRGNIISDTKRNTSGIEYDFRNLPLTMQKGAETFKYRYDETGNRILKQAGGKTEYYVRDHSGREVGIYDKDDGWKSFNLFGNGLIGRADVYYQSVWVEDPEEGMVEVQQRIDERFYYIKDHLGSIRVTIDQNNNVSAAQDYSAYGEIWRSLNSSTPGDRYKFTEKELDIETGYAYHGARYYDPWRITWNSSDPLEDYYSGYYSYNYCFGNPLILIDPSGLGPADLMNVGMRVNQRHRFMKDINGTSTKAISRIINGADGTEIPEEYKEKFDMLKEVIDDASNIDEIIRYIEKSKDMRALLGFIAKNPAIWRTLDKAGKIVGRLGIGLSVTSNLYNIYLSFEGKKSWFDTGYDLGTFGVVITVTATINPVAGVAVGLILNGVKYYIDNYEDMKARCQGFDPRRMLLEILNRPYHRTGILP